MRRRIWKIREQLALDSKCEQYNATDGQAVPSASGEHSSRIAQERSLGARAATELAVGDLGSGGQGKEQIIIGILDRMDQESRFDLPVEDGEVVAGPERPLKLGTRLFPLRRRRQSATRWHQTRSILGWGEMSK